MNYKIVILSKNPDNLVECVRRLKQKETNLLLDNIIVVNDGAKEKALVKIPGVRWVEGEKPFVFARNANIGLRAAEADCILLNDDALLNTKDGLTKMVEEARNHPEYGLVGAATDVVGNFNQVPRRVEGIHPEATMVCFVCVYIPKSTFQAIGPLDERFVHYGFDDDDYCLRARKAGLKIGIYFSCVLSHGELKSTFREQDNFAEFKKNEAIFVEKWGANRGKV